MSNKEDGQEERLTKALRLLTENRDHLADAKKRLLEQGANAAVVDRFSARQIVIADEYHREARRRDDVDKYMSLPYWQAKTFFRELEKQTTEQTKMLPSLFDDKVAGSVVVWEHFARDGAITLRRLPMLQIVEGIRMYAASNAGRLPPNLDSLKLPLPINPMTGRAFVYELKGDIAHLTSGESGIDAGSRDYYEIAIKKP
jgi:hypothetical protein